MKWMEVIFIIVYLIFTIYNGIKLRKINNKINIIGIAILVLGIGDSFHLIPRIVSKFTNNDLSMYLGIGKLVTSITMSIFYILLYYIYLDSLNEKNNKIIEISLYILLFIRIVLLLLPSNNWVRNSSSLWISIVRNIPFILIGIIIIYLYYKVRNKKGYPNKIKYLWIIFILSFLFYMLTVVGAFYHSMFGMFMIPKTICYMLVIQYFKEYSFNR